MAGISATRLFLPPSPYAQPGRRQPPPFLSIRCMASSKLFIGGLASHTDDKALMDAFAPHGEILEVKVVLDRDTGISRGFAFITFKSESEADAAYRAMDGEIVNGRVIRVDHATNKPRDGRGSGSQRRSSYRLYGGMGPLGGPGPLDDKYDQNKSGWLENSPSPEDFGPIYPKICFGPKMLQGGYEYIPPPDLPPYVAPASTSANSSSQKVSAIRPSNDLDDTSDVIGSSPSPVGAKSFSDDISPVYQKSSPQPFNDTDPAYSKIPGGMLDGIGSTSAKGKTGLSDGIGSRYPESISGISDGIGSSKMRPDFSNDIGPAYPRSTSGFSGAPGPKTNIDLENDIGTIYQKSSSSFAGGSAYRNRNSQYSASSSVESNSGVSDDIDYVYPKSSSSFSGGSSTDSKSPGFLDGPATKNNLELSDDDNNIDRTYSEDPDFPGAYVDRFSNPPHMSRFEDSSTPLPVTNPRPSYRRMNPSLPRNTRAFLKNRNENRNEGIYTDNKANYSNSESIHPAYSKGSNASLGGPTNVKSSPGISKDIGPSYPDGGYSYSFASSVDTKPSHEKIENIDPACSNTSSGNSEVGSKYVHARN